MKNPLLKKARNYLFYILIQLFRGIFFLVPRKLCAAMGAALGTPAYYLAGKEREKIFRNLDYVFEPKLSQKEKIKLAKDNFKNYGIGLFEFIKFSTWPMKKIASLVKEVKGWEYFEKAKAGKKGLIGVTCHMSNWEIIPLYSAYRGINVGVVAKKLFDERIGRAVNATRTKANVKVYDRDASPIAMIRELKSNGLMLGVLVDQDTRVESIISPFLGKPAKTPTAPAVLAKRLGVILCTIFITRRKDGFYSIVINKPYNIEKNTTVEELAEKYNNDISAMIKKYPEQWVWVHERWKSVGYDK